MRELVTSLFGKAFAWITGKFLGEVIVSLVVTVAMAGMFSRSLGRTESSPGVPGRPAVSAAEPLPSWRELPLDLDSTGTIGSLSSAPSLRLHRLLAEKAPVVPLPPRRPAAASPLATAPVESVVHRFAAPVSPPPVTMRTASPTCARSADDTAPCPPGLIPDGAGTDADRAEGYGRFGWVPVRLLPARGPVLNGLFSVRHAIGGLVGSL